MLLARLGSLAKPDWLIGKAATWSHSPASVRRFRQANWEQIYSQQGAINIKQEHERSRSREKNVQAATSVCYVNAKCGLVLRSKSEMNEFCRDQCWGSFFIQISRTGFDVTLNSPSKQAVELTCGVDNAVGADDTVRCLDIPSAIRCRDETGHRGGAVDLGAVHPSSCSESHGERVRINVSITGSVQTC